MDAGRLLIALGLTAWIGGLAGAAAYVGRRMRFPKSVYAPTSGRSPGWPGIIAGLILFAITAYSIPPNVTFWFDVFASGVVTYWLGAYVVALAVERRRAIRLSQPEPGTEGVSSVAEFAAFLAFALLFGATGVALLVYGIANEIAGSGGEGAAGLGLGGCCLFIGFFMGLFGSPLLVVRRRRQFLDEPDLPAQGSSM